MKIAANVLAALVEDAMENYYGDHVSRNFYDDRDSQPQLRTYEGRGYYGTDARHFGIVTGEEGHIFAVIAAVQARVTKQEQDEEINGDPEDTVSWDELLQFLVTTYQRDTMGLGSIHYWTGVEVDGEFEEGDEY